MRRVKSIWQKLLWMLPLLRIVMCQIRRKVHLSTFLEVYVINLTIFEHLKSIRKGNRRRESHTFIHNLVGELILIGFHVKTPEALGITDFFSIHPSLYLRSHLFSGALTLSQVAQSQNGLVAAGVSGACECCKQVIGHLDWIVLVNFLLQE